MDLENYTNINIFKKVFEKREVSQATHVVEQPHHQLKENVQHHKSGFNPYVNNQGTTVGKYQEEFTDIRVSNHIILRKQ